jgi:hypothetical protein
MKRHSLLAGPGLGLLLLASLLPQMACEGYEPPRFPVGDTVELYSLARPEYVGLRSGFDFISPQAVVIEQPKIGDYRAFDMAFSELDGDFVLLPAGLFETFDIQPGIVELTGTTFDALEEAPGDGYETEEAVRIREDGLYVVRSRASGACSRYAKMEVLALDPDGILEFRFLRNNLCNDRTLTDIDEDD